VKVGKNKKKPNTILKYQMKKAKRLLLWTISYACDILLAYLVMKRVFENGQLMGN
jgi:hypothetical protein